ncbi:MAG: hypothetical protein H0V66_00240, partial [Bdellovibrionales bacterium]|nr:hypothetical protein [Bdellovibrionales bacterium]
EEHTDEPAASDGTDAPARPKNKGVGKRINELTKDKHDAIRERDYWREQAMRQQAEPQQIDPSAQVDKPSDGRPMREDYDFDEDRYLEAFADWHLLKRERAVEQAKAKEQERVRAVKFEEQAAEFAAEHPDFYERLQAPDLRVTEQMKAVVLETDNPPAVAYHLATHPDEAAAIAQMTPIAAARAIGRIEASLSVPTRPAEIPSPPKTVTSAPAVASSVSARSPVVKPAAAMSVEDHIEKLRVRSSR